jgi:hypothetical protein
MAEAPVYPHPYESKMSDATYCLTLPSDMQAFFKSLSNTDITRCSGKTAIMALNLAQRRPVNSFTKGSGRLHSKEMIANEIKRLLTIRPITLTLPCCDWCQEPVGIDDQAWSKDKSLCIHMNCDADWEEARGEAFPYECADSESESESEPEVKPEAESESEPEAKKWKAPWGSNLWRLARGDVWDSGNDCWEVVKGELFNYNTTTYLGKYDDKEEEITHGPRPRNPAHRFVC